MQPISCDNHSHLDFDSGKQIYKIRDGILVCVLYKRIFTKELVGKRVFVFEFVYLCLVFFLESGLCVWPAKGSWWV